MLKIDLGLPGDRGAIPARFELSAFSFELSAFPSAPYGPLAGEVRLEFTGQEDYTLSVPFTGYVAEEKNAE